VRAVLSSLAVVLAMVEAPGDAPDDAALRAPGPDEAGNEVAVQPRVTPGQARGLYRGAGVPAERRPRPARGAQSGGADATERRYPVGGAHTYGDGFGDRPNHQGQDILAACGTPLRATQDATARLIDTEGSAGRYVVLRTSSGRDLVYMHLSAVDVSGGQRVRAGERIGDVGQTGNASTCHLHFEVWEAPGWYTGGEPRDPAAMLRSAERPEGSEVP
jgi:murein DD-endopeptidase MepM/ murein hydrolase activator NlpD